MPKFSEAINVTAPVPRRDAPFPANLRDIILGTKTAPPTGAFIDPSLKGPRITNPRVNQVWQEIASEYPFAASQVSNINVAPSDAEYLAWVTDMGGGRPVLNVGENALKANKDLLKEALLHELVHVLQMQNFPDVQEGFKAGIAGRPYLERPAEQQAYAIGLKR